jgi:hypothetical protein
MAGENTETKIFGYRSAVTMTGDLRYVCRKKPEIGSRVNGGGAI